MSSSSTIFAISCSLLPSLSARRALRFGLSHSACMIAMTMSEASSCLADVSMSATLQSRSSLLVKTESGSPGIYLADATFTRLWHIGWRRRKCASRNSIQLSSSGLESPVEWYNLRDLVSLVIVSANVELRHVLIHSFLVF